MIKAAILKFFNARGFQIIRSSTGYSAEELGIIEKVKPFTGTGSERLTALINSVKYLVSNKIEGDFVECGVWRGGSMMAAMYTLQALRAIPRDIHLFDTFEGMSEPSDRDVMFDGQKAKDLLEGTEKKEGPGNYWCWASLGDVRQNVLATGYPKEKIHFVKGKVEDTIPKTAPEKIALLRLDTDWYESTAHELKHLYPRLSDKGVLIIDDYGHWQGARQAVDEFFSQQSFQPLFNRLDYTGRLVIKSV